MADIGRAVRVLRAAAGKSQKAVAEEAELSAAYVSQIEAGQKEPAVAALRRIAAALDSDVSTLLSLAEGADLDTTLAAPAAASTAPAAGTSTKATPRPSSRRGEHFRRSRANAEAVLRDPWAIRELTTKAGALAEAAAAERLGDVRDDLRILVSLLAAFGDGTHRAVPWESLVLISAALLYFVSPEDVVPDYLAEGYLDDAAVIAFVAEMVAPDLDAFTGPR